MLIKILLIVIAAIAKAIVDTIVFHAGGRLPKKRFFDNKIQGKFLPFTKYPVDGKHVFNSVMIVCFIAAAFWGDPLFTFFAKVLIAGIVFIIVFNFLWNKILN